MKENVKKWSRRMLTILMCIAMLLMLFPMSEVKAQTVEVDSGSAIGSLPSQYVGTEMVSDYDTYAVSCTNHNYNAVTYGTTCQTYAHTCYTCINCGDSYDVYPDEVMSDWQTVKPDVDTSIMQTAIQYRYSTYDTFFSDDNDLEGYEFAGNQWVQYGVNTVNYVNEWPVGFDAANSLYNMYDNLAQKLPSYSTELTKVEINSDRITGYLYYHWCRSGYASVSATQTGNYNRFHAYYSTVPPASANASNSNDGSYRFDSSTACSDSKSYFAVPVYAQTYTAYKNQFVYRYWSEPSQWSLTPVETTEDCKVETRTVYRYVTAALSAHKYVNNVCSVCGEAMEDADYYLFGWINGGNYACDENYLNMGDYKFVDGKLTATFMQDSYVAIKTEGNTGWYMTEGWQGEATSVTLYNANSLTDANKLFVPGGVELEFTLVNNGNDTLTLSYMPKTCAHNYEGEITTAASCLNAGKMTYTCTVCGHSYILNIAATGHRYNATVVPNTCTEGGYTLYSCGVCGSSYKTNYTDAAHSFVNGSCISCGATDASQQVDYYLVGWINGADYGCDSDYTSMGQYKFVDGKLTATFNQDSYVFIKTGCNTKWLLAASYCEAASCTFSEGNTERMYVPGNVTLTFTLTENANGSVTVSYAQSCNHSYTSEVTAVVTCTTDGARIYTCTHCGDSYIEVIAAMGHAYVDGTCVRCYTRESGTDSGLIQSYYLVGWINGADHGCEGDWENLGDYKIEDGKLTVTFTQDSYVFVKSADNSRWMLAESYCEDTTCTFSVGKSEKMFVPGGVELTFTLVEDGPNSVTLSYVKTTAECTHSYTSNVTTAATCTAAGVKTYTCSKCNDVYTETVAALGHYYVNGFCTICGISDPDYTIPMSDTYYLIGWINGADHGCESDWENMGNYKFVNGKLTAIFTQDSYVFIKNGDNSKWFLAESYCEDTDCTFVVGASEKMFVPGGVQINFTLTENADGSVTLSYATASSASTVPTLTLKAPTLEFKDMITVNAFYTAENIEDVIELGMITYSSKVSTWDVATAEHVIPGAVYEERSGCYYSSSQGIHAKYLGDTVYLAIYAKLSDGSYAYSKLASYSAVQYATNQLKNSTDAKLKQLVAAMLNYGAEAQLYFGHNTSNLANSGMTAEQEALLTAYNTSMVSSVPSVSQAKQGIFYNNKGFSKRSPAVSFEGAFSINYFFTPTYVPDNGITLYYWNVNDFNANSVLTTANATGFLKMSGSGTGEYRGDIVSISAKALTEAVYVAAVYTNGGTTWTSGVLGYSIGSYCGSQASKGGAIADLAKATAVYGYYAKSYFG